MQTSWLCLALHQRACESWENIQGAESLVCLLGGVVNHISNVFSSMFMNAIDMHKKFWSTLSELWRKCLITPNYYIGYLKSLQISTCFWINIGCLYHLPGVKLVYSWSLFKNDVYDYNEGLEVSNCDTKSSTFPFGSSTCFKTSLLHLSPKSFKFGLNLIYNSDILLITTEKYFLNL